MVAVERWMAMAMAMAMAMVTAMTMAMSMTVAMTMMTALVMVMMPHQRHVERVIHLLVLLRVRRCSA